LEHYWQTQLTILGEVLAAMCLGALLGANRQFAGKAAGIRTLAVVSGASVLFIAVSAGAVGYQGPDTTQAGAAWSAWWRVSSPAWAS